MRGRIFVVLILFLLLLTCVACQSPDEKPGVWFVHATDPHLYYDDEKEESIRLHQEPLNRQAFSDLIQSLRSIPGTDGNPRFLLLTGDLGLDRFAAQPALRESAVAFVAEQLKASPVKNVYLVLGNNDVKGEAPQGAAVDAAASFFGDVQSRLAGSGVVLHDLTSCYRDKSVLPSGCYADIPGTSFRLTGFSSYSFKNANGVAANQAVQEVQVRQLATLVKEAAAQGKRTLVATHIPELDDPYPLGLSRWQGKPATTLQRPQWAPFSAWNVSPAVYQTWKNVVDSGDVAGVLAGHLHDSHKEIYYPPYRWSTSPSERADLHKLFLAPPLSVRFQDTSPVQARGFALFHLEGDQIDRRLFWYDPVKRNFRGDPALVKLSRTPPGSFSQAVGWLWSTPLANRDLARAVVIAIAFLAAFLTVVQLWDIPPPESRLATPGSAPSPPPAQSATTWALTSNFAKTVLAGLGGMLVLDFLASIWSLQDINGKSYYVLLFVIFFFLFLFFYALLQSAVEALRSRIATRQQAAPPRPGLTRRHGGPHVGVRFWAWAAYWRNRIWRWLLSLRAFALIFLDTFFNVIRGRNQLHTKVFEDTIIDLHLSVVRAADRIREDVDAVVTRAVRDQFKGEEIADTDVRVSITLLSEDESVLYYLSRERGSLPVPFEKRSMAWVSVYTGEARWFKQSYLANKEILLLDNSNQAYPALPKDKLTLVSYFQARFSPDYEAFLVLPVPWGQRGAQAGYRKGAIHISFLKAKYLDALWTGLDKESPPEHYDHWQQLLTRPSESSSLGLENEELRVVLHEALQVLGELLRSFNDTVFEEYIKPNPRLTA